MRYLLDTSTCVYAINRRPSMVNERLESLQRGDIAISCITVYELWYGVCKSATPERNTQTLRRFLSPFVILPFEQRDAERCGEIRVLLEKRGTPIGPYDLQIAAQASSRTLIVVTHNTREFSRVPGLITEDWVSTIP